MPALATRRPEFRARSATSDCSPQEPDAIPLQVAISLLADAPLKEIFGEVQIAII
jgi:hypothetical protein